MVIALGELDLGIRRVQSADLLERFGRNDQIGRRTAGRGHIHFLEPVAVGRHHPHPIGTQLPQHPVQDGSALFGGRGERHMAHKLVDHAGRSLPGLLELDRGERGKLVPRQAEQLEFRATRLDRDTRFTGGCDPHRACGQLARDIHELLGRECHGAIGIDLGSDCGADGNIEICAGEPQALLRCFDKNVGEHRECRLGGNRGRYCGQAFLQLFPCDGELHASNNFSEMRESLSTASLYRNTSSSSRQRGYVGDTAKAQPGHHVRSLTQCWRTVGTVGALRISSAVSPMPTSRAFFPTPFVRYRADNS